MEPSLPNSVEVFWIEIRTSNVCQMSNGNWLCFSSNEGEFRQTWSDSYRNIHAIAQAHIRQKLLESNKKSFESTTSSDFWYETEEHV